jgi:endoglucanase
MQLYVDDFDRPGKQAIMYPKVSKIFEYPRCHWYAPRLGRDVNNFTSSVTRLMQRAYPSTPSVVLYNIPNRDGGQYSKGGADDNEEYVKWITEFANGIRGQNDPFVIFEPDALTLACGPWDQPPTPLLLDRIALFNRCLPILQEAGCRLYVDIGHPRWLSAEKAGEVLNMLDAKSYDGFCINVSNFIPLDECIEYGTNVSSCTDGKHFIIDTSRNGTNDHNNDWCNPKDKRLGMKPTMETGHPLIDAFLWIKVPGESDGYCDGGPKAGIFWAEYAAMLLGSDTIKPVFVDDPDNSLQAPA